MTFKEKVLQKIDAYAKHYCRFCESNLPIIREDEDGVYWHEVHPTRGFIGSQRECRATGFIGLKKEIEAME